MDSIIRSIPDKDINHDDGGVTDGEEVYHTSSSTTTTSGSSSTVPVVVGELSSEIDLTMSDTNTQHSFTLQQQHRTISGMSDDANNNNTNDGVSHEGLLTANVVVADEEIPVANQVIDDDDEEEDDDEYEYEDDDYAAFSGFIVNNDPPPSSDSVLTQSEKDTSETSEKPAKIEEELATTSNDRQEESVIPFASSNSVKFKSTWRQPTKEAVNMSLRAEKESNGLKRRLLLDLYRIMNQDTDKAGFTLVPSSEDTMDTWTIKLFQFDEDSKLAQDMKVLSVPCIELEMKFPEQYPFEPPFVRVAQPRFRRQTGFVMNGALCMELLTKDGWNPINDIESVIVSIRSLLVVGDGRLEAACNLPEAKYALLLEQANQKAKSLILTSTEPDCGESPSKKLKLSDDDDDDSKSNVGYKSDNITGGTTNTSMGGSYSLHEAQAAYSHLSEYHKKKGWDTSGWWARKG